MPVSESSRGGDVREIIHASTVREVVERPSVIESVEAPPVTERVILARPVAERVLEAQTITERLGTGRRGPAGPVGGPGPTGPTGPQGPVGPPGNQITVTHHSDRLLSGHRLVSPGPGGSLVYTDCHSSAHLNIAVWLTLGAVEAGSEATLLAFGMVTESSWSWTPGRPLFVGPNGYLRQSLPDDTSFWRRVGEAISPTTVLFHVDQPISLVIVGTYGGYDLPYGEDAPSGYGTYSVGYRGGNVTPTRYGSYKRGYIGDDVVATPNNEYGSYLDGYEDPQPASDGTYGLGYASDY